MMHPGVFSRAILAGLLGLAVVLGVAPRTALAGRIKVAVVPSIAVNLDAARVDALSQDLAEALRTELDVDAIGGLDVRRLLPPQGLPPDCVANQVCVNDVAKRLGAQQLLFVVMIDTGAGGAIQVDSTWVDAVAHVSAARPAIDIAAVAGAKSRFISAAARLLPDAPVRPKPKATALGRMSTPVPRHFTLPAYLAAGGTLVGLGVGITLGTSARSKYQDCEDLAKHGTNCSTDRKDSIRRTALLADIGWLAAIGGTIATAIMYGTSGEASHVIVEPTPGGAAITAVGSF
ncbi:MAG TPA: hypothetical protein VFK02_01100 [Kofleriaceae bacterium]|nr:hypothetical protein [Kofleriaceae bacterium]